jgi:eukaryotic-like serine/threonine-protein kinase
MDLANSHDALQPRLQSSLSDRYSIERELGAGGMATVYLAEDLKHHRKVAIKVLHAELSALLGPERFLKEIELTASLQHPHILPLFDSGSTDGLLYYVMPYVSGETLRTRLDRERQLPVADALRIARETADALQYAHTCGVVHRDIKPENILLQNGHALVADFGIALAVEQAGGQRMTQTGLSLGTPRYMSPEQAMGEREIGPRSDIYSLGAVTYEMLAGDPPFVGSTAQAIVAQVITSEPRSLVAQRKSIPPHVDDAVMTALEKLPADRFDSAAEFASALGDGSAAGARVSSSVLARRTRSARWRRFAPWCIAVVMALVALGVIAAMRRSHASGESALVMTSLLPPDGQDFSGRSDFGALSPDGRHLAFVFSSTRGESSLWLRRLDSLTSVPVPGSNGAQAPFWSPDGSTVAFFARNQLWRVGLTGGMRELCDVTGAQSGSWAADGTILIATARGIERANANGGSCTVIVPTRTEASGTMRMEHPVLLPDGQHLLFSAWIGAKSERITRIFAADLRGGAWRQLIDHGTDPTFVSPDLVLYGRLDPTVPGFVGRLFAQRVDPATLTQRGDPVVIADGVRDAGGTFSYTVSSTGALAYLPSQGDGKKLVVNRRGQVVDTIPVDGTWTHQFARSKPEVALGGHGVVIYDMARRTSIPVEGISSSPVWGPGDSVLAGLGTGPTKTLANNGIHRVDLTTGADTLLMRATAQNALPSDWSHDGRYLFVTRAASTSDTLERSEIWAYDFGAGRLIRVLATAGNVAEGALSPDGKWLAYDSDESGANEVYVRPFLRPGAAMRISIDGGRHARWRGDGRELYFETGDGRMMSASVAPGVPLALGKPDLLFRAPSWIRSMFFDSGIPYDVNRDGTQFVLRMAPASTAAVLVQNWPALLGAK